MKASLRGLRWNLYLVLAATALLPLAQAQSDTVDRVTFFTDPNYKGESLTIEAGQSVPDLSPMLRTNQFPWLGAISSVRIDGNARVTVFDGTGFRGQRLEITNSISDLYGQPRATEPGANWDRCIASLVVSGRPRPRQVIVTPTPMRPDPEYMAPPGPPPMPPPEVEHRPTYTLRTADVAIERAYRDVLGRAADPAGLRHYREKLLRDGWTEGEIYADLKRSAEARALNPDTVITQAYRDELGREPDPQGLDHYRRLWRQGWTPGQIREDLRRSAEGREAGIKMAITRAYRDLLGREPDPEGFARYERMMRERGWAERQVRASIMESAEYRRMGRGR